MRAILPIDLNDTNTVTNVPETDNPEWVIGTTYPAGFTVMIAAQHEEWESVAAGNVGNDPMTTDDRVSDTPKWIYLGATNPYKMLGDRFVNSQTVLAEEIEVTVTLSDIADGVALFNLDAQTVTLTMTDPVEGEVYTKEHSLMDVEVDDYYDWFFKPPRQIKTVVDLDLPPYPDAELNIKISNPGDTAKCGALVLGQALFIGESMWAPKVGMLTTSKISRDDFGRVELIPGYSAKEIEIDVFIENDFVDDVYDKLSSLDAIAAAFIGDDADAGFNSINAYGFFTDFSVVIPGPGGSGCSIKIEGFI